MKEDFGIMLRQIKKKDEFIEVRTLFTSYNTNKNKLGK